MTGHVWLAAYWAWFGSENGKRYGVLSLHSELVDLSDWQPVPSPQKAVLAGIGVRLEPLDTSTQALSLFSAAPGPGADPELRKYLPEGPLASQSAYTVSLAPDNFDVDGCQRRWLTAIRAGAQTSPIWVKARLTSVRTATPSGSDVTCPGRSVMLQAKRHPCPNGVGWRVRRGRHTRSLSYPSSRHRRPPISSPWPSWSAFGPLDRPFGAPSKGD